MHRRSFVLLLAALTISTANHAQELTGRLKRIKDTGTLVLAHGETAMPFSFVDNKGPLGFGVDISKRIAESIKTQLGMAEIKVRWNPVTLSTRFPMIVTGTVDLECVTTTNTKARQKMVGFSNSFYISDEGIATRKDSGVMDYADLAGKRVVVVRGTTTEKALVARNLNITLVPERNNRRAMAALAEGRADAYIAAAPIAGGELLRLRDAKPFHIVGSGGYKEAFGCMMPKDDPAYKEAVDNALAGLMASGEMERIYNKWFMGPVPPIGQAVNLPLNNETRALYAAPNDTALE
jgi:glutamate/aspartate transport system substrate-binding protein